MLDYELIEKFKEMKEISSDYATALALKCSRGLISDIKKGRRSIPMKIIIRMNKIAGDRIAKLYAKGIEEKIISDARKDAGEA